MRLSSKRIFSRSLASRLDSGSSSSSSCGSMTSARASASRCCWPPDSFVASRSASSASCTAASTRITFSLDLLCGWPRFAHLQRKGHVLEHVHVRPDRVGLKHHAEIAPVGRDEDTLGGREHDASAKLDLAALRPLQSGDGAQRRGLAAAARPEQREQGAVGHIERHVLCGFDGLTVGACIFRVQRLDAEHASLPSRLRQAESPARAVGAYLANHAGA